MPIRLCECTFAFLSGSSPGPGTYEFRIHGLGYGVIDIRLPAGIVIRDWILATPVDTWRVHLRVAASWLPRIVARLLARSAVWLHTNISSSEPTSRCGSPRST